MDRRQFLKIAAASGLFVASDASGLVYAAVPPKELFGVLVDTTRCIGCRRCEEACARSHGLPVPDPNDASVFGTQRTTGTSAYTVVNRYAVGSSQIFVKRQCMHCNQPGCGAACLVKAMLKIPEGPVIWRESKCMGCRYCMVSCPFDVPKFEYDKAIPKIQKCDFCFSRLQAGLKPACVEACPVEALVFGTRREVLEAARARLVKRPDAYFPHIYGEREAGGTGWLYLAGVPFDKIGFNTNLSTTAYPEFTTGFLYSVPFIFVLWPTFLFGLSRITRREGKNETQAGKKG